MVKDYSKGKIYKIEAMTASEGEKCYIGSTTKTYISQRFAEHVNAYHRWKAGKYGKVMVYELFEKYGIENCKIQLLEVFPCSSSDELTAKEAEFIKKENAMNKVVPRRTKKQYWEEKKDYLLEKKKEYRENNKEEISKTKKIWYEENKEVISAARNEKVTCECGGKYTVRFPGQHFKTKKHHEFVNSLNV